ncbi:6-carboxytetrahydropterin synthase [Pediococcus ethanolidurans]|uniref:6-carboxytetrahydropterin synthase n=1 Tax=Pediococcus ethanolidurans TaxID=319653 RepID=UPI001C1EDDCE|nr:6-carboxytetrahydropterin synthase [Pediococcus ethanolidurans]MBU7554114.1 6-carboxytetrahydropterin synthase [Pediococcus ethanolidurans]MBU7562872.1 6-carboxytetrahydropterin synthase [Pediococcus ethanolidurans]MCV3314609.1 6-carboxytetrahydropterin synthase [Pediococcus ethanolidurans]MCV3321225.1 6-carboxytetrahydropterin synthase [Pediococcus ethanolidurans]MCV3323659.1 6-carboxytetrahydropterin synthase [Pediococcus ethanolidurans]
MKLVHTYKIKSYVNASHAMRWKSGEGQQHIHTWKIVCEIRSKGDHMIVFRDIEQAIKDVLDSFSGKFLNKLPYFKEINPTVENVTIWLFDLITPEMEQLSAQLIRIEVSESPTRSYSIEVDNQ